MDPTSLALYAGKEILDSTKPQQGIFWNHIFLRFFGGRNMLNYNEIARAESENTYSLKRLEGKIMEQQIIQSLQEADGYIEYQNLFQTLQKALPKIQTGTPEKDIDPDKIKRLKDLSKEFSSDDMQEIIAGILAGEYNNPGTYSLKTMDIVKSLSKDDIELFRRFGSMVVNKSFIFGNFQQIDNQHHHLLFEKGVGWNPFLYLQELGIFSSAINTSQKIGDNSGKSYNYKFQIGEKEVSLVLKRKINLDNQAKLTKAGQEIFSLIASIYDEDLFKITKQELISIGFEDILNI